MLLKEISSQNYSLKGKQKPYSEFTELSALKQLKKNKKIIFTKKVFILSIHNYNFYIE